jgi:hypothetical protein
MTAPRPDDDQRRARTRTEPETPDEYAARMRLLAERRVQEAERHRQFRAARKADQARAGHGESEEQSA